MTILLFTRQSLLWLNLVHLKILKMCRAIKKSFLWVFISNSHKQEQTIGQAEPWYLMIWYTQLRESKHISLALFFFPIFFCLNLFVAINAIPHFCSQQPVFTHSLPQCLADFTMTVWPNSQRVHSCFFYNYSPPAHSHLRALLPDPSVQVHAAWCFNVRPHIWRPLSAPPALHHRSDSQN